MREVRLHYDLVVKVLFQVLSALVASVAIVHCEDLNFGPVDLGHFRLFGLGLYHIQDDRYSVLIRFPHQPNMCISRKRSHHPKPFIRRLRILKCPQIGPSSKM